MQTLFTDGQTLFFRTGNAVHRFDGEQREHRKLFDLYTDPQRKGDLVGLAAAGGRVFTAFHGPVPFMDNATTSHNVDLDRCTPRLRDSVPRSDNYGIALSPRRDFVSYFRLMGGFVGGDSRNTLYIETEAAGRARQHVVLAFREPVPLGSLVFPAPEAIDREFGVSVLNADAPYPPRPSVAADWTRIDLPALAPWNCVPVPTGTHTRALRLTWATADADLLEQLDGGGDTPGDAPSVALDDDAGGESRCCARRSGRDASRGCGCCACATATRRPTRA